MTTVRHSAQKLGSPASICKRDSEPAGWPPSLTAERIYHLPFLMLMLEPKSIGYKC
ncbi:rCG63221 [Rattus norvegicus]|uniref:RCG63221 n=1 Tax=Rattus norvegicus TaxID=10116 RepID=A6IZP0_RAT|nr:rCG63221 [Rattus norvegicus]